MADHVFNVLFLCTGNSARSIMAEAILAKEDAGRFQAFSAGSFPKGEVHPSAIALLKNMDYETNVFRSKSWDEFSGPNAPKIDFVFTVCDNAASEPCPIWPGHPMTAHWGIPDPAAVEGTEVEKTQAFADAYRVLNKRIEVFINLPIESLDKMSLKHRFDEIGQELLISA
ncbi:MAG: arsenate reductase ArsC [Anderseniella sp.]